MSLPVPVTPQMLLHIQQNYDSKDYSKKQKRAETKRIKKRNLPAFRLPSPHPAINYD
jgi:plasmid maintenance system antidote protein VapI